MADKKAFHITDADKEWVDKSFDWLIKSYGYPARDFSPIIFIEKFFPNSIRHVKTEAGPLLKDLCNLFKINPEEISFELEEDIRDTAGTPYEIAGRPFESDLQLVKTDSGIRYRIFFAKSLLSVPKRLVFNGVFQFLRIQLSKYDTGWLDSDHHYFLFYLVGIYTGWGVILAQTMIDIGRDSNFFWEKKWRYISPMPIPVMVYGMALHSRLIEEKDPAWKEFLPTEIKVQYEKAIKFVSVNPHQAFNKQELARKDLIKEAAAHNENKSYDEAIETYQRAIFHSHSDSEKSHIYHNIGYALICKGEFEKSISYFQKSIELSSGIGYAYENLSFAFIMLGDTKTGMFYHSLAGQSGKRIQAYAYRNLAVYHQKRGESEKAEENFQKAFEHISKPVDWLEYLYARFLFDKGEKEEALFYLQIAVEKREPNAIKWQEELEKSSS